MLSTVQCDWLTVGAHENTDPNYRKDVLQMSDKLTWPLHTDPPLLSWSQSWAGAHQCWVTSAGAVTRGRAVADTPVQDRAVWGAAPVLSRYNMALQQCSTPLISTLSSLLTTSPSTVHCCPSLHYIINTTVKWSFALKQINILTFILCLAKLHNACKAFFYTVHCLQSFTYTWKLLNFLLYN